MPDADALFASRILHPGKSIFVPGVSLIIPGVAFLNHFQIDIPFSPVDFADTAAVLIGIGDDDPDFFAEYFFAEGITGGNAMLLRRLRSIHTVKAYLVFFAAVCAEQNGGIEKIKALIPQKKKDAEGATAEESAPEAAAEEAAPAEEVAE